ncbi:MAG: glycosyltransferase [Nitrospira sp. LK70]|nr:glycosyltransferase [Nitrospira sp. LK70]
MIYSIAIPVLGQANFLPTALSSIQVQACRFQLAVMDATPDNSVQDVLKNYTQMLSYHRHGQDAGQSAAIQEGWDHTEGDILAWLCADDYYFPYALEEVDKIFASRPEVDVVYGDSIFVDREGNFLSYFIEISDDIRSILHGCCISQPSCFIRRTALCRIGKLDTTLHYIMDWDLWTRLYKARAKFHYLRKPLSAVRVYSETKTASRSKKRYGEINRHLKCNVGLCARIRSLLAFYYYDLLIGKRSMTDNIAFHAIELVHSIKNVVWKRFTQRKAVLYGIESYSNKVFGECEIYLPLYGNYSPRQIVLEYRNVDALQIHINGHLQNVAPLACGEDSYRYVLKVNDNLISNLLKINLRSPSTNPWQFVSLRLPSNSESLKSAPR